MKHIPSLRSPIFALCLTIFGSFGEAADPVKDPCDEVVERACSSKYLEDPTGGSSGGNIPPPVYSSAKKQFEKQLSNQLSNMAKTKEWSEISEWVLARHKRFQNTSVAKQVENLCSDLTQRIECESAIIELLTHEMSMNLFLSTDIIYRKENRVVEFADSSRILLSSFSSDQISEIKVGTHVRIGLVSELHKNFPDIKKIYIILRTQIQQSLLFDVQRTEQVQKTVWSDSKIYLSQLVKQFDEQQNSRYFEYLTLKNLALNAESDSSLEDLLILMSPNAQYIEADRVVTVENGMLLSNTSYFGNFFLFAHELAHSIDPCFLGLPIEGQYWYPGLVKYLRNEVGIKDRSTSYLMGHRGSRYFCAPEDQIGEAAADAIATEVFSRMLESKWSSLTQTNRITAVAQALRPFRCDEIAPSGDTHLSTVDRYKKIILKNPRIRKFLGCRKD